jgi:hypothetical protein
MIFGNEQRRIVAYLDGLSPIGDRHVKVNGLREPHKGVILQVKGGEELRPFFRRTLRPSALERAFKGAG